MSSSTFFLAKVEFEEEEEEYMEGDSDCSDDR